MNQQYPMTGHLPCVQYGFDCAYADRQGHERAWLCCGVQPAAKMLALSACPQLAKARQAYQKAQSAMAVQKAAPQKQLTL